MTQSIFFDVIARDKASSTFSRVGKASETARGRLLGFSKSAVGAALGFTSITLAAGAFVRVGADYVGALNKIQALTGANDATIGRAAKTLEANSSAYAKMGQTVGDAAGGVVELTKAGLSLDKSLKAVNATMVLAKAGEMSVADASSLVANTLNTFHLKAKSAGDIANYLANAANISSADVTDLAESLKYVAPVAASTGVNLKQTSAILAELSNSGIAASNAGTGFRKFLLSLQAPSGRAKTDLHDLGVEIFDAQGKMKPLGTVIDLLGGKLDKLTDQQRQKVLKDVFGLQGISSATVILKGGAKGLEQYSKGVTKAGAAQKLAEAGSKGFAGTLAALRAEVISDAQAAYRKFSPALDDAAKKVLAFVQQMKAGKGAGGDFVSALKSLAQIAGSAAKLLGALPGPVMKFGIEGLIAYAVLRKLQSATTGYASSLSPAIAQTKQFYAEMTYSATRAGAMARASAVAQGAVKNLAGAGGMMLLASSSSASNKSTATLMQTLGGAATGFAVGGPVGAAVGGLAGLMLGLATNTHRAGDAAKDTSVLWKHYADTLDDATAALTRQTTAEIQQTIRTKHLDKVLGDYGFTNRQIVQAIQHQGPLRQRMITDLKAEQAGINAGYMALVKKNGYSAQETIAYGKSHKARADAIAQTLDELGAVTKGVAMKREDIAATRTFSKALKALPSKVETYVRTNGLKPGISGVVELARQIKLTPKEIRLLIRENGGKGTDAEVKRVQDRAIALGKLAPVVNVSSKTDQARAELGSFYKYLLNVTKDRTVNVHVKRVKPGKPGGIGGLLQQGVTGGRGSSRMIGAGERTANSYAEGIHLGARKVKNALSKLQDMVTAAADKLANLRSIKAGFLSTFSSDSIFGADLSGGGGINALMDFEQKQATKARQLLADVQKVASMGLSKALIAQLQAAGSSGADQLHALAGGTSAQIQALNALDVQTSSSLQQAGMLAGNTVRGGSINADISNAAHQEQLIERLIRRLDKMNDEIVVEIDGEAIIRAIKRRNRRKGIAAAGI